MSVSTQPSSTLDGLQKPFVNALRTLFEVLDDKGTGFVKFTDIEARWQDDGTKGLPKGVIESLRKVTPPNGLLSFERFCAGLKICLLRHQMEGRGRRSDEMKQRPPSAPILDTETESAKTWGQGTATRGIAAGMPGQRTLSMPQLPAQPTLKPHLYGPPKPPRVGLTSCQSVGGGGGGVGGVGGVAGVDKAEIRSALHNWQMGVMMEEERRYAPARPKPLGDIAIPNPGQVDQPVNSQQNQYKKTNGRRREPRRHTLQNGVDYNMLKRMKQIELEKDVLMQGLEAVDRARDWYLKQISAVQEKMQYVGRMGYSEQWSDAQEERLGLQRARIFEVNRHLSSLTDPGERGGLPLHMNLAVNPHPTHILGQLKHQNHFLTQEVSKKNERITALEREKASLIRELFHTRAQLRQPSTQDNTPFL